MELFLVVLMKTPFLSLTFIISIINFILQPITLEVLRYYDIFFHAESNLLNHVLLSLTITSLLNIFIPIDILI